MDAIGALDEKCYIGCHAALEDGSVHEEIEQFGNPGGYDIVAAPALEAARSYIFKFFVGEEEFEVSSKSIVITP